MTGPGERLCSVVVPVYNGARFLDEALASVFAQTWRPIEVIVVDDGSTDETPAVIAGWPEAIALRQENAGVAAARNLGIARARGDFIALLDADDLWEPEKLRLQIEHLDAHPELGAVCAGYRNFLEPGAPRPAWLSEAQLATPHVGLISNFLARSEALARVGAFDVKDWSDLDWSLRAREVGVVMGAVDRVLCRRRIHEANVTHSWDAGRHVRFQALRAAIARKRARGTDER